MIYYYYYVVINFFFLYYLFIIIIISIIIIIIYYIFVVVVLRCSRHDALHALLSSVVPRNTCTPVSPEQELTTRRLIDHGEWPRGFKYIYSHTSETAQ